jgi:hypothetical protein
MLVTENLNGHAAGNGRYSQGDTYGPAVASSTRRSLSENWEGLRAWGVRGVRKARGGE